MSSSFFNLDPANEIAVALPQPEEEPSRVHNAVPERPVRSSVPAELPVQLAVRGTRRAGPEWLKQMGRLLERTLLRLLGPDAPLESLLESALFEALSSWPPRSDQVTTLWGQRIAAGVALGHLKSNAPAA